MYIWTILITHAWIIVVEFINCTIGVHVVVRVFKLNHHEFLDNLYLFLELFLS